MAEVQLGTLYYNVEYRVKGDAAVSDARATEQRLSGIANGGNGNRSSASISQGASLRGGNGSSAANITPGAAAALRRQGYQFFGPGGAGYTPPGGNNPYYGWVSPELMGGGGQGGFGAPPAYAPPPGDPTVAQATGATNWPGSRAAGGRTSGLTNRFFAMAVAHEAMGAATAARQFNIDRTVAGNNQQAQFDALMASRRQMGSLGFGAVGFFGNMREDPTGAMEASAISTIASAQATDVRTAGMGVLPGMRRDRAEAASLSGMGGSALANAKADFARDKAIREAGEARREASARDNTQIDKDLAAAKAKNLADNPNFQYGDILSGGRGINQRIFRRMVADRNAENAATAARHSSEQSRSADYDAIVSSTNRINEMERAAIANGVANANASLIAGNNVDSAFNNNVAKYGFTTLSAQRDKILSQGQINAAQYMAKPDANMFGAFSIMGAALSEADAFNSKINYAARNEVTQLGLNTTASFLRRNLSPFSVTAAQKAEEARAGYDSKTNTFLDLPNDPNNPNYQAQFNARLGLLNEAKSTAGRNAQLGLAKLTEGIGGGLAASRLSAQGFYAAARVRAQVESELSDVAEAKRRNLPDDLVQQMRETAINNLRGQERAIYQNGSAAQTNAFLGGVNFGNGQQVQQLLTEIRDGINRL